MISGYVITRSLEHRPTADSRGAFLAGFYRRRIQRLVPALSACVVVTALLTCLVVPDPAASLWTGLLALAGASNVFLHQQATDYFGTSAQLNSFTHTWFLGVDYQFYLVFPLAAWQLGLGRAGGAGRRRFRLGMALVAVLSLILFLQMRQVDSSAAYFLTGPRVWELAVGCLLTANGEDPQGEPGQAPLRDGLAWGAFLALVGVTLAPQGSSSIPMLVSVAATCALIRTLRGRSLLGRLLTCPPVLRIGQISYSLYLWHWRVIVLSRWTIGIHAWSVPFQLLLILGLAELSYRTLETPFGSKPWAPTNQQTILIGVGINAAAATMLLLLIGGGLGPHLYLGQRPATLSEERRNQRIAGTTITSTACLIDRNDVLDRPQIDAKARTCSVESAPQGAAQGRTIFVVGDSHATALIPLAAELHREGAGITLLTKAGCPFPATAFGHLDPGCERFQDEIASRILATSRPGDGVLITGYQLSHLGSGLRATRDHFLDRTGQPVRGTEAKTALYMKALDAFSDRAGAKGLQVALIGAGPRLIGRELCLPEWFRPARWSEPCLNTLREDASSTRTINVQLSRNLPDRVHFIDPMPWICPKGCSLDDLKWQLADDDHLTAAAVRRLKQPVLEALSRAD